MSFIRPRSDSSQPLRVLIVQSQTEVGGVERNLLSFLKYFDRRRLAPLVVTLGYGRGPLPELCRKQGAEVIELRAGRLRNPWGLARTVFHLAHLIKSQEVSILLSNELHPHVYARLAGLLTRRPTVCWIQNVYQSPLRRNEWLPTLSFLLSSDHWIANSEASAAPLRRLFPDKRIEIVYPGVDLKEFIARRSKSTLRKKLGINRTEKVVAMLGRLQPWKGQDVFLRAAALIAQRFARVRFLLVGEALFGMDRDYPRHLKRLTGELGLWERVIFTGFRTDIPDLLNLADIIVHASIAPEPFGRVIIEAMALGKPVVATNLGGPREIIADGETGILIPPRDSHALAAALQRLLRNPVLRWRLGRAGRRRVQERFTAESMTARLQSVLSTR